VGPDSAPLRTPAPEAKRTSVLDFGSLPDVKTRSHPTAERGVIRSTVSAFPGPLGRFERGDEIYRRDDDDGVDHGRSFGRVIVVALTPVESGSNAVGNIRRPRDWGGPAVQWLIPERGSTG